MSPSQHVRNPPEAERWWHETLWDSKVCQAGRVEKAEREPILCQHDAALLNKCRYVPTVLSAEVSHRQPVELLFVSVGLFIYFFNKNEGKTKLPAFCSLRSQQGPRAAALSWAVALITSRCCRLGVGGDSRALIDRGQDEAESHVSWLWSLSLRPVFFFLRSSAAVSPDCLCFTPVQLDGALAHAAPGAVPHLCWAPNQLFYSLRARSAPQFISIENRRSN